MLILLLLIMKSNQRHLIPTYSFLNSSYQCAHFKEAPSSLMIGVIDIVDRKWVSPFLQISLGEGRSIWLHRLMDWISLFVKIWQINAWQAWVLYDSLEKLIIFQPKVTQFMTTYFETHSAECLAVVIAYWDFNCKQTKKVPHVHHNYLNIRNDSVKSAEKCKCFSDFYPEHLSSLMSLYFFTVQFALYDVDVRSSWQFNV